MSRHRHAAPWALGIALSLAGCAAGNLPPVNSDADRLAQAHHQYQRGNYSMAIPLLSSYVTTAVGSAAVDEALYLLGDCYVRTKDYPSAAIELERLLRDYPESDSAAAAALRLGDAYWGQARPSDFDQAQTLKALEQWQSYLRDYPGHWAHDVARRHVAQARGRLADKALHTGNLYIKLRKLAPARVYFERVVEEFP